MRKHRNRSGPTERLSVGFIPEQMRRIEEVLRVRTRKDEIWHKTDLIRDAVNLYLSHQDDIPGTRAAITRKLEEQLQRQSDLLEKLVTFFKKWRGA